MKNKVYVVKRLSQIMWSTSADAMKALTLNYLDALEALSTIAGWHQNQNHLLTIFTYSVTPSFGDSAAVETMDAITSFKTFKLIDDSS